MWAWPSLAPPLSLSLSIRLRAAALADMNEFAAMLPLLGVKIASAKVLRYFKYMDKDGSGSIDLDEFRVMRARTHPLAGWCAGGCA